MVFPKRCSLALAREEIKRDEKVAPKPRRILTQTEIQRRIRTREAQRRSTA